MTKEVIKLTKQQAKTLQVVKDLGIAYQSERMEEWAGKAVPSRSAAEKLCSMELLKKEVSPYFVDKIIKSGEKKQVRVFDYVTYTLTAAGEDTLDKYLELKKSEAVQRSVDPLAVGIDEYMTQFHDLDGVMRKLAIDINKREVTKAGALKSQAVR